MGFVRFIRDLYQRWQRDDTGMLAAAVAYYGAMSLFPLLLILTSGLGVFLKWTNTGKDARQWILDAVAEQLSPALAQNIELALSQVQDYAGFGGPVGAITLLVAALAIFAQFERAFDRIWSVPPAHNQSIWSGMREMLTYRMRAFSMLLGLGVAVVLVFATGWALAAFQTRIATRFQMSSWVWWSVEVALQVFLNALVFATLYRMLPKRPVSWRHAWFGGFASAVVWEIGRQLLTHFVIGQRYTSAYGVIGTLLAIMIWAYYGICVVLGGAQFVCLLVERFGMAHSYSAAESAAPGEPRRRSSVVGMAAQTTTSSAGSNAGLAAARLNEPTPSSVAVGKPAIKRLRKPGIEGRRWGLGIRLGWIPEVAFAVVLVYLGSFLAIRQWGPRAGNVAEDAPGVNQVVIFSRHPGAHQIARAAFTPLIKILPGAYRYPSADELMDLGLSRAPQQ